MVEPRKSTSDRPMWVEVTVAASLQIVLALYLSPFVSRGWFPSDEGLLAHSAERVLQGELPHRDFDDPYTGGQAILHAAAFATFGVSIVSLRWCLFLFAQLYIASLYLLTRRCLPIMPAATVTILAVVWSLPIYFSAMPSWYVLFLECAATVCVIRFSDTGNRRWLVATGLLCGLAFLFKVTVLYYVAAVLFYLLYRAQTQCRTLEASHSSLGLTALTFVLCLALIALTVRLLSTHLSVETVTHLQAPILAVCGLLITNERFCRSTVRHRVEQLICDVAPFVGSALVPVILFLIPYWASDSLSAFWQGVLVVPQQRLQNVTWPLPPPAWFLPVVPVVTALFWKHQASESGSQRLIPILILALVLGFTLWLCGLPLAYLSVLSSLRCAAPFIVFACSLVIWKHLVTNSLAGNNELLFLFTVIVALAGLVQYPVATTPYFAYFSPFVVIALALTIHSRFGQFHWRHRLFAGFYLAFGLVFLNQSYVGIPDSSLFEEHTAKLGITRSGLLLRETDRDIYANVIQLVQESSERGDFIYAAPDCPEIYFLASRKNPTRRMYDVFGDSAERNAEASAILRDDRIKAVVVNMTPAFSEPMSRVVQSEIRRHFPVLKQVGPFIVALRGPQPIETPPNEAHADALTASLKNRER